MTAVAPPLSFQPNTRIGWTSNGNGFGAMSSDEVSRMFTPGPRKTAQRQNSSSSLASNSSTGSNTSTSTVATATAPQTNGAVPASNPPAEAGSWAARKKPTRGLWPAGKAEPATGISTARPQTVNAATTGPTASSAISALHTPLLPSQQQLQQQMANGATQTNGARTQQQPEPTAILHLLPMNNTFERKTMTVPYYPEVLRIGRQTNQKTIPTPLNGYFDSKVLSRQHAEVYADRQGRVFIRDVKSSNGTFIGGKRLSPENKESDPWELKEQEILELGIDIVSEDQKTVVHHKVAAKVEHCGIYGQGNDALNFGDLDPSAGAGILAPPGQLRRTGSQGSMNGRGAVNPAISQAAAGMGVLNQPQHMRNWLNPITTEHIVKKLNTELKFAMQQSQDLARARQSIEAMLNGKVESPTKETKEPKSGSEKSARTSPTKSKTDLKAHFSEPPAPPPSAPLPEKPDVARALADPLIQPLLRRSDTAKPTSVSSSPTRNDHSRDMLRLCEELKLAKGELSDQSERMKSLETELAQERTARESAEERAHRLEQGDRRDSPRDSFSAESTKAESTSRDVSIESPPDLQVQLDRLRATMDEMKIQMESYRSRAETAEAERDTLAEKVERIRKENDEKALTRSPSRRRGSSSMSSPKPDAKSRSQPNGHAVSPAPLSPTSDILLESAGVEEGRPITPEQAKMLTQFLSQEVLKSSSTAYKDGGESMLTYHGRPIASAAAVILVGVVMMTWMNGWPKVER